jgi:adenosine deaminase
MILLLQMAEYRISIYGRKQSEWDQLASWIVNNELYSENVVWLIQVLTVSKSLLLKFIFFWSLKGKVG